MHSTCSCLPDCMLVHVHDEVYHYSDIQAVDVFEAVHLCVEVVVVCSTVQYLPQPDHIHGCK